jgi:hypothetical protein
MKLNELKAIFDREGQILDVVWQKSNYDRQIFPNLAKEVLEKIPHFNLPELNEIHNELKTIRLPAQTFPFGEFSDLPLTISRHERFCFDLYFWYRTDTNIHNHHFSGAFKIVKGSSLQIQYQFDSIKKLDEGFDEGILTKLESRIIETNEIQTIELQEKFIHQVFHNEKPTITLCLRSTNIIGESLSYFIFPKYRILMPNLKSQTEQIIRVLSFRLNNQEPIEEDFGLTPAEIIRSLYQSPFLRHPGQEKTILFFKDHLKKINFATDFFELQEQQVKINEKLKQFGIISNSQKKS